MTEHPERHERSGGSRRELTPEEEKFFGADADAPESERIERGASRGKAYGASGAASREAPERTRIHERTDVPETMDPADPDVEMVRNDPGMGRGSGQATEARVTPSAAAGTESTTPLFPTDEAESLRTRWDGVQAEFVDEPRAAVEKANTLVGDVMQRLTDGFSQERSRLERQWDRGDDVSTEDLRVALKRYRSFFDRLLSI